MKRTQKRGNQKGFTLIELLAVIVILAILMTLAVVSMSQYIQKAKQDTYVTTALQMLGNIRFGIVNGEYEAPPVGQCTVVSTDLVQLESGVKKSPFDKDYNVSQSFVVIKNTGTATQDKYTYYVTMNDGAKNGFPLTEENVLKGKNVQIKNFAGVAKPAINGTVSVGGTNCTAAYVY